MANRSAGVRERPEPPAPGAMPGWRPCLDEALGLGAFLFAAASAAVVLLHPASPLVASLPPAWLRRLLMGLAMGGTAVALIRSRWGQRSGAHLNPATTFCFWLLGKVPGPLALGYLAAQCLGGVAGLVAARVLLGSAVADPAVDWVTTKPGPWGPWAAFGAEVAMVALLLGTVLRLANDPRRAAWTPWCAGGFVALYIAVEAPVSGMSLNPARTLASAVLARDFTAFWVYATAPTLGAALAAYHFVRRRGLRAAHCARLHHTAAFPCVFRCTFAAAAETTASPAATEVPLPAADRPERNREPWTTTTSS